MLLQALENGVFSTVNIPKSLEDLRGGIVPELLVGGNCSFQGGIKEVCRKVLGGLGTQEKKGTRGGHHILIK